MGVRVTVAGLALLGLAACAGGGGDGPSPQDVAEDRVQELSDINDRLSALPIPDALPATGTARYEGVTGVAIDGLVTQAALVGDTAITADFATNQLDGRATDFVGRVNGGAAESFDGSLTIDGTIGAPIGGGRRDNGPLAAVDGRLDSGDHVVTVDGDLFGTFSGNAAQGIQLIDLAAGGTLDGTPVPTQVVVAVER